MRFTHFAKRYRLAFFTVAVLSAPTSALSETLNLRALLGAANAGVKIDKDAGGSFTLEGGSEPAVGLGLTFDLVRPETGPGFRTDLAASVFWHKIRKTGTDGDLGTVTLENNWTASSTARVGYDFGNVFPYVSLGLGLNDLSVGTNGATPDNRLGLGHSVGFGLEATFSNGWVVQGDILANSPIEFDPAGGGGNASTSTIVGFVGATLNF